MALRHAPNKGNQHDTRNHRNVRRSGSRNRSHALPRVGALMANILPKSLHTVTAIVNVARHLRTANPTWTPTQCVVWSVDVLGYGFGPDVDPYGLKARALAILEKGAR